MSEQVAAPQADSSQSQNQSNEPFNPDADPGIRSVSDLQKQGQQKPDPKGQQAPKSQSEELFDVKINGKMRRMTRQEVINHASMAAAAEEKFSEAAKMRREREEFEQKLSKDPINALRERGLNDDQIRETFENWYSEKFIDPETLSPQELKLKEYEQKVKAYEAEKARQEEELKAKRHEELVAKHREAYQQKIISLMEKSKLPKTSANVMRIAAIMEQNMKMGWNAPDEIILQQVSNEFSGQIDQIKSLPMDEVVRVFGQEFIDALMKHTLENHRKSRAEKVREFTSPVASQSSSKQKRVYTDEVTERLRKLKMTGDY